MAYDRCPDCGGFIDKGSCVCALSLKIREAMKKQFKLTDDELDRALENGQITITRTGPAHPCAESKDIQISEIVLISEK